jgi:hypothetical protein
VQRCVHGDTIEVGPGRYDDANRDGDFTDVEDEPADMIHLVKGLTLRSRDGAGMTILDVGVIERSSIFGNRTQVDAATSALNCGIVNTTGTPVQITTNFWGAATGLGSDPADRFCVNVPQVTPVAPFATKEIKVKAKAAQ